MTEENKNIWDELNAIFEIYDGDFHAEGGAMCMWSGTLRMTLTNPEDFPSRSITFFTVAHPDPESAAREAIEDFKEWLGETGNEPIRLENA